MLITDVVVDMNTVIARSTNAIVMNMIVIVEMSVIVNTNITNVNVKKKPQKSLRNAGRLMAERLSRHGNRPTSAVGQERPCCCANFP